MDDRHVTRFTTLWTKAQPTVFAFVSSAIVNFADAEDVLQRVAGAAVQKFEEYDDSRPFLNWVIGIARFEVLRYLRDSATDRHRYVAESLPHIAEAFETIHSDLDARRKALSECLKGIQGQHRDILEMRYAEGMKSGRIAEALGTTSGNISVILNRIYRRLRNCIELRLASEVSGG